MKKIISTLLLSSLVLIAQNMPQMGGHNMENMMQEMQKMQTCMAKINFDSLAALQEEAVSVQQNIDELCKQGKREKAQSTAINFSDKVMKYPAIVQLKQCSKGTSMQSMMQMSKQDFKNHHVCDGVKTEFGLPSNQRIQW